ncbi:hypothetical protein C5F47_05165 [Nitrosopumilus cobalaminigenes]|uniref:Uncharacterized protein n=1 Tax=Nitrosopumilus cobalaminigenes TaxID=1470066 RepID=A0A7D5R7W2_9ARCH|nr:hypothetical protein [Nitrosopumilus cobalaminigenes]QLH02981.1 hypothetical protein C5F47_05165 [Nitrosopumilus cobalaminigenes]
MQLTKEFGMTKLAASCPQCNVDTVYCGMIPTEIKSLTNKEVLFCKSCKFVIAVDEYKNILSQA